MTYNDVQLGFYKNKLDSLISNLQELNIRKSKLVININNVKQEHNKNDSKLTELETYIKNIKRDYKDVWQELTDIHKQRKVDVEDRMNGLDMYKIIRDNGYTDSDSKTIMEAKSTVNSIKSLSKKTRKSGTELYELDLELTNINSSIKQIEQSIDDVNLKISIFSQQQLF
jgi:chromosome segregation ATPase